MYVIYEFVLIIIKILVCIIMNALKWIGRKVFYHESLAERQFRKLGKIDLERALLHNNDEKPIIRPPEPCLTIFGEGILPPIKGLPPSYTEAVKKKYSNNKKKKRNGKRKV